MNLITDKWIPAWFADGTTNLIAPYEIANSEIIGINIKRADLRGAVYQFLIGLLQISIIPKDNEELMELLETSLSVEKLKSEFFKLKDFFNLFAETGKPAFMQDLELIKSKKKKKGEKKIVNEGNEISIGHLLIDYPSMNGFKNNTDHFVKRNSEVGFCLNCTAMALFCLQINAPSGGSGHKTSIRGGGPLTTLLILPNNNLWQKLVINLSTQEDFPLPDYKKISDILPWIKSIDNFNKIKMKIKDNDGKYKWKDLTLVTCEGVNKLHTFWSMPRRIRLQVSTKSGCCSICGKKNIELITNYISTTKGIDYYGYWYHPLSPHKKLIDKEQNGNLLSPFKGQTGGIGITDWLSLNFDLKGTADTADTTAAKIVANYHSLAHEFYEELDDLFKEQPVLWCFGYDMDNMKVKGYYDQHTPIVHIEDEEQRKLFITAVKTLLQVINKVAGVLRQQLKQAWFSRPKDKKGDFSKIDTVFYANLEDKFYSLIKNTAEIKANTHSFINVIRATALNLFDHQAMNSTLENTDIQRIVISRQKLEIEINKQLKTFKEK